MKSPIGVSGRQAANDVAGWVPTLARIGYAAKGAVYLLVGFIAFNAANAAGTPEGPTGAMAQLRDQTGGQVLLVLIAAGLLAHTLWRVVQAALDPEHAGDSEKHVAARIFAGISAVIHASLAFTAWRLSRGAGETGDGQEMWITRVLGMPGGGWLVMAAGIGVMVYGVHQLVQAARGEVDRHMAHAPRQAALLGRIGTGARGAVMLPIGWFVFNAGRHYSASTAADMGEVLGMFDRGGWLAVTGIGLLAYGLHQFAKAVYRRIERPQV